MELLYNFNNIVWAYVNDGSSRAITKHQDGNSYISYPNASFSSEKVMQFKDYKGKLYALISNETSAGRLLRLDAVNEGTTDTWTEVLTTSDLDSDPSIFEYFEDKLYIFSTAEIWSFDGENLVSVTTSLPNELSIIFYSINRNDKIYLLGAYSGIDYIVSYDGATTFVTLVANTGTPSKPSGFSPVGKKLMVEYKGKIYWIDGTTIKYLASYNIEDGVEVEEMLLGGDVEVTCLYEDRGIIYMAFTRTSTSYVNIMTFVPEKYIKELPLVSGEGRVSEGLKKVVSDPIFLVSEPKLGKVTYFKEYPIMCVLKGLIDPVVKYGKRLEFYSDLNDIDKFENKTMKDMMDELTSVTNNFFQVDAHNTAKISPRDLVGYSDKFMDIVSSSDYGDSLITEVVSVMPYEHNFRKVIISWDNNHWQNNSPVAVGSTQVRDFVSYSLESMFINDPILAKNIGLHLLNNMDVTEMMNIILSYSYFIEGGEVLSFDIQDDIVEINKDREWKVITVNHSESERTTTLLVLERSLLEERYVA